MAASEKEADSATPTTLSDYNVWCKNQMSFFKNYKNIEETQDWENKVKLKKLFNLHTTLGVQNEPETKNTLIFLSAITVMQVIFWTGDHFCFLYDCGNSVNCKPKKSYKLAGYF